MKNPDGTILDNNGVVVFFSLDAFISNICEGTDCFLCGEKSHTKEFNAEHVIPKWILKKYNLFNLTITLPNDSTVRYDQYTVPCCKECNSFLGENIEKEISSLINGGIESVNKYILDQGPWKIFLWLALIFFKTHLKDSYLRKHQDRRMGDETIAHDYEWGFLHHIHCMVRAIQTGISIENECLGSLLVVPAKIAEHYDCFDYKDVYIANTMLLRVGDMAFVAVLDDSCAALHFFDGMFKKLNGELSPIQLREVLSHLTLINYKLKHRPIYLTTFDANNDDVSICAVLPTSMELDDYTNEEFGEILYENISSMIDPINSCILNSNIDNIKNGSYRFLFDEKGKFQKKSMDLKGVSG